MSDLRPGDEAAAAPTRQRPSAARRLLGLAIGLAAFAYLFSRQVSWNELAATLAAIDLRYVPPILLLQVAFLLLGAAAVGLLLRSAQPVPASALTIAYLRSVALGAFTPAAVGEFTLAWFLRPFGVPVRESLAVVTVDKTVTLASFSLWSAPALVWAVPTVLAGRRIELPWILLLAAVALLALGALAARWLARWEPLRGLTAAVWSYLAAVADVARRSPLRLAGNLALTLSRVLAAALLLWLSVAAFGVDPAGPVWRFVVLTSAARLLAFFLPSPNGLGVYEVLLVELLAETAPAEAILSGALLARAVGLVAIGLSLLPRVPAAERDQR